MLGQHRAVDERAGRRSGVSPDAYFREIPDPADHPTFRIEPIATGDEA